MEQGSLRCDVNVSLSPAGSAEWGTRTETKNVNSLRSVERAVRSSHGRNEAWQSSFCLRNLISRWIPAAADAPGTGPRA